MADERYRVQSLGRALDLLEHIAAAGADGTRLTDLAGATGLSKAAAYAILQTFLAHGVVADSGQGATRRYRLGLALVRLGDLAVASIGLADTALPVLRDLTRAVGMTSRVAVLDHGFAVVIGRVDGPGSVQFEAALGRREWPHCSGVGKALLAAMPRPEALAILRRVGHPNRTPHTLCTLAALETDFDRIALRRYAVDDEEDNEGVFCLAACVFDRGGEAAGAISVTGLKQRLPEEKVPALAETVIDHADQISQRLGGPSAEVAWARRRPA
jgi:IclR family acetate operon transcriptional repressor